MNTQEAQNRTFKAVADRGYLNGPTQVLIARQICKLVEELAEAAEQIKWPIGLEYVLFSERLSDAGKHARLLFDSPNFWAGAQVIDGPKLESELTDMQVVLHVAAGLSGFDVAGSAPIKAEADVVRGKRGAQ